MEALGEINDSGYRKKQLIATGLISFSGLALEIGLTRLFSVLFFPPSVFAILSLAILGIGLGAALVTWRESWRLSSYTPIYLGCSAISVVVITIVATLPGLQYALFGLVLFPYLFIGMALTTLFSGRPQGSPQLYLADLLGAGLGALLSIPLLNLVGGLHSVLSISIFLALGALILARRPWAPIPLGFLGFCISLFIVVQLFDLVSVDMARLPSDKPIADSLSGNSSAIIDSHWDAFARTDLVDPGSGEPLALYMDGAAGSIIPPAENDDFLYGDVGFFPFATEQPERVFLIGPGGGLDVWFALQSGTREVVGVEVNQASVAIVNNYAEYNGDLYGRPNVTMVIDDGRSVLRREDRQFDLIFLSQVVTFASERNGYSLVENSSYTIEAFTEYLDHLTPGGQVGIKLYDEPTLSRALSTVLATFRQQGLSDQEGIKHVIALLDGRVDPPIPLLVINKEPFTQDDALTLGAVARQVGFTPLFLPGVMAQEPLDGVADGTITFTDFIADSDNDLSATTDDRPFFYQFERGLPKSLRPLLWGVVVVLLVGAGLLSLHQRRTASGRWAFTAPLYFAGLGLGYIMIEIGVIQQTRLYLGHPTTATAVVLATLLISGGAGSGLAGRWFREKKGFPVLPVAGTILLLLLWRFLWPWLQGETLGARLWVRAAIVVVTLAPLGLLMGMPFPLGLRAAGHRSRQQVALAWTVNGVLSVAGSILAVSLAILFGFSTVLLGGGAAYGLALLAAGLTPAITQEGSSSPAR